MAPNELPFIIRHRRGQSPCRPKIRVGMGTDPYSTNPYAIILKFIFDILANGLGGLGMTGPDPIVLYSEAFTTPTFSFNIGISKFQIRLIHFVLMTINFRAC